MKPLSALQLQVFQRKDDIELRGGLTDREKTEVTRCGNGTMATLYRRMKPSTLGTLSDTSLIIVLY
jgi:hypothetical protein